jgi:ribulose-phosphate 3-epimerase
MQEGGSVTFHVEACADPLATAEEARRHGLGVGVALNPETPVEAALAIAAAGGVDIVLCVSIHPGYSGMPLIPEARGRMAYTGLVDGLARAAGA